MRKNNMFGIVIKEEWKLDRKKFLIILGVVFAVNLAIIALLGFTIIKGIFNVNVTVNDVKMPRLEFVPVVLVTQIFIIMLMPVLFSNKLLQDVFKNDSRYLYKMLPITGFELFGGKLIINIIEFALLSSIAFITSLISVTQLIILAEKQAYGPEYVMDFSHTFEKFLEEIMNYFGGAGFDLLLTFTLFMCALCGLFILVSVVRHSFSINLNSKLIGAIAYIICFAVMFAIGHIRGGTGTVIVLVLLTVGTFIANCILYDKRVSV